MVIQLRNRAGGAHPWPRSRVNRAPRRLARGIGSMLFSSQGLATTASCSPNRRWRPPAGCRARLSAEARSTSAVSRSTMASLASMRMSMSGCRAELLHAVVSATSRQAGPGGDRHALPRPARWTHQAHGGVHAPRSAPRGAAATSGAGQPHGAGAAAKQRHRRPRSLQRPGSAADVPTSNSQPSCGRKSSDAGPQGQNGAPMRPTAGQVRR